MHHEFNFKDVLASSYRAAWQIEDVLPEGAALDFGRRFMPEALARVEPLIGLDANEKTILNQIRGHEYLSLFGLVEEFILPFVLDHARPQLDGDDHRVRALLNFASEEAKHIHLFREFHRRFTDGFDTPCALIGPAQAIADEVLGHDPLAVALLILMIEWMTQSHYVDSVKDDRGIDPLFASLLRHHWMEEAQHAKLDTLMVEALAEGRSDIEILRAVDEFVAIGAFLDGGLKAQASYNLDALEAATGRRVAPAEREQMLAQQHQALRFTYIGSGMLHPKFRATLGAISPDGFDRIAAITPVFC